jgi:hypothetical protein
MTFKRPGRAVSGHVFQHYLAYQMMTSKGVVAQIMDMKNNKAAHAQGTSLFCALSPKRSSALPTASALLYNSRLAFTQ